MNSMLNKLDEIYSKWSILDKFRKEIYLDMLLQQANFAYRYLLQVYNNKGFFPKKK